MKLRSVFLNFFVSVLSVAYVLPLNAATRIDLLGKPTPPSAAMRTIVIGPDTKAVNVTSGEVVKFVVGNDAFIWNFDTPEVVESVDLNRIAPKGVLQHSVRAYVRPNPLYFN